MKRSVVVLAVLCCSSVAGADDWPAWRGPTGQGYCFEKDVPLKWSATENVKWKIALPHGGNSTPIVWKNKIFLTVANKGGTQRSILCLDRADGKKLWQNDVKYEPKERNWNAEWYCNASPTTDGERVYVSFGSAGLYCYTTAGDFVWKRTDLGPWQHQFGNGSSPVLYGDLCILYCGPNETSGRNFVLAVDKKNGKTVWEKDSKAGAKGSSNGFFWGTPTLIKFDGKDQLLYCTDFKLRSLDPKTGDPLWQCDGLTEYVYTSPLFSPELKIAVAMSGYNKAGLAVKVGGSGDITKDRLWLHPKNNQRVGSGIIVGDHVYILEDNGTPKCIELKSGKQVWQVETRPTAVNWGSMVHVDGKLYCLARDGTTSVFKASPTYEVLATNRLDKGETTNSSPAISNGEIFLRTNRHLWCIGEKK
jgi:outer membrane protein assembly factor BamB